MPDAFKNRELLRFALKIAIPLMHQHVQSSIAGHGEEIAAGAFHRIPARCPFVACENGGIRSHVSAGPAIVHTYFIGVLVFSLWHGTFSTRRIAGSQAYVPPAFRAQFSLDLCKYPPFGLGAAGR